MLQRLNAVLRHPLLRRALYLVAFGVGGYLCNGTPWLRWVYTETRVAAGSETFRAVITSWPVVIAAALLLFRDPLARLIRSLRRLGYRDAGFEFLPQEQELLPSTRMLAAPDAVVRGLPAAVPPAGDVVVRAVPAEAAAEIPAPGVAADPAAAEALATERWVDGILASTADPYIQEHEQELQTSLEQTGLLRHPEQAVRLLTRFTINWFVTADFERTYGVIWGAQIHLLRELASIPMPMTQAAKFVSAWVAQGQRGPDSIERWADFLGSVGLVAQKDAELHITPKGRSFLLFLARNGKSDPPPYY